MFDPVDLSEFERMYFYKEITYHQYLLLRMGMLMNVVMKNP